MEELSAAASAVLKQELRLPRAALVKILADLFGFRPGKRVQARMSAGIDHLLSTDIADQVGEVIQLQSE